ncbi:TetR/AcrR family transcriptional regulator [Nocardioides sp. NPDC057772]|uniref:TetR/AcrR family transcriptional regulator n=1 Tax=Nocardioides sp. NPDC057772 TaxID=3346245 RepID=UPI0036711CA7
MTADTPPRPKRRYARRLPVEQRREHLLDAALRVIARDGYESVSIEAIAREADVTRPVVYSAYDGLEPLLHALLDRTQRRALASAVRLMPQPGGSQDVAEWALEAYAALLDIVRKEPDVWRPVLGLTRNAPAVVRDRIDATRELIRGYLSDAFQEGVERNGATKTGSKEVDVDLLAHLTLVTAEEFARLTLEDPDRYDKDRLMATVETLISSFTDTGR